MNRIPNSRLTRRGYNKSKSICDGCKKDLRVRNLVMFKGKFLCRSCRNKEDTFKAQSSASQIGKGHIKLADALNKIYEIKTYESRTCCIITLPFCFEGKKVKLSIVEDESSQSHGGTPNG
jgi:hypothetical protein